MSSSVSEQKTQKHGQITISAILPKGISVAEKFGIYDGTLLPEEDLLVASALPKRRAEFAAGRACARLALARLGLPAQPILCGLGREPVWPLGVIGSITHCEGYCAAAVAYSRNIKSVGIDAEPNEKLPDEIIKHIASEKEIDDAAKFARLIENWDRLLFSAKESAYKAWYSIHNSWLGFQEVSIELLPESSNFSIIFRSKSKAWFDSCEASVSARYLITTSHLLTATVVEVA